MSCMNWMGNFLLLLCSAPEMAQQAQGHNTGQEIEEAHQVHHAALLATRAIREAAASAGIYCGRCHSARPRSVPARAVVGVSSRAGVVADVGWGACSATHRDPTPAPTDREPLHVGIQAASLARGAKE